VFHNRDDFTMGVKRILAHRAGHCCSRPSCRALTAGPSEEGPDALANIGVESHITAASPAGPRFDAALSVEERCSAANGIWLCQNHAKEIDDDVNHFTADLLRTGKRHSEEEARALLGRPISAQSLDIEIQVTLHRALTDDLIVVGATNLPNGTKLFVELQDSGSKKVLGQCKTIVLDGFLAAGGFRNGTQSLPSRTSMALGNSRRQLSISWAARAKNLSADLRNLCTPNSRNQKSVSMPLLNAWRLPSPDRLSPRLPIWIAPSDSSEMPCSLSKGANQPPQSAR
jgi:hypothetical protein